MNKEIIATLAIILLLVTSCKDTAEETAAQASTTPNVVGSMLPSASSTAKSSVTPVASGVEQMAFTSKWKGNKFDQVDAFLQNYQKKLIHAVNSKEFSIVEPTLAPDGPLYQAQKKLVDNLGSRNIKEWNIQSTLYDLQEVDGRYQVKVTESVDIEKADHTITSGYYNWIYEIEELDGKLFMYNLKEWANHDEEFNRKAGGVKADNFAIEVFMQAYPSVLQQAINTLDLTDLESITENDTTLEVQKQLILELRKKADLKHPSFTVKVENVWSDQKRYIWLANFTFMYTDSNGKPNLITRRIRMDLNDRVRGFDHGISLTYMEPNYMETQTDLKKSFLVNRIVRIHSDLPEILLQLHAQQDGSDFNAAQIDVQMAASPSKVLQSIPIESATAWNPKDMGLVVEDMNFDGYQDIRLQQDTPVGPNVPYLYWLWDSNDGKFVRNEQLEEIVAPEFDPENKLIYSRERGGAGYFVRNMYLFESGAPILIQKVEREADPDRKVWKAKVWERKGKELQMVKEYEDPLGE